MKKFEYKKVFSPVSEDELNNLGKIGWELVHAEHAGYYIFKREIA
jgi:hypothetical protein